MAKGLQTFQEEGIHTRHPENCEHAQCCGTKVIEDVVSTDILQTLSTCMQNLNRKFDACVKIVTTNIWIFEDEMLFVKNAMSMPFYTIL